MMKKLVLAATMLLMMSFGAFAQTVLTVGDDPSAYYSNLEDAFNDINAGSVNGDIVLQIIASCTPQTGTAVLYPSGYAGTSDYNSVTIYPVATGLNIESSVAGPLIELNGVTDIIFDGRVNQSGSATDLVISNTSTDAAASTIRFAESANNNTISYCIIKGAGTGATKGILEFSTSSGGNGNDGNRITNNLITADPAGRPVNAVYSSGSATRENSGNIISDNSFYDVLKKGVNSNILNLESNTTGWTISGNSFYETSSFIPTASTTLTVINVNNPAGSGFQIIGNYFGGSSPSCGGSAWIKSNAFNNTFIAIKINAGTAVATSVQNNTVSNFSWSNSGAAPWTAIEIISGNVNIGTVAANTIGSPTGTGSIVLNGGATGSLFTGINIASAGNVDCRNNTIGAITLNNTSGANATSFYGIRKAAAGGTTAIISNIIGSESTANSIQLTSAATGNIQFAEGIISLGTGNVTIGNNRIANISNSTTNASGTLKAISLSGSSSGIIEKNFIHNLAASSGISGINITKGTVTAANNIISINSNNPAAISGLYLSGIAGDNYSVWYNTVYIGGSATSGTNNSSALASFTTAETRDIKNNLLVNARSNSGSTGKHYGIYFASTGGPLTCNYNDYYVSGSGGTAGYYGGDITTVPVVTAQDANSLIADPLFTAAGGPEYTDYRISNGTLTAGTAVAVTDDYTALTRASTPTIGALEAGSCSDPAGGGSVSLAVSTGCSPFDPAAITNSVLPSGYIGTLEYKWQYSVTGPGSGFIDIPSSNAVSYNPASLTANTWFRRLARVACSADWSGAAASNTIAITVNTPPVAGAITGTSAVCRGTNVTLTANATGTAVLTYTWLSSNTAVATVNNSGLVTSLSAGTTNITYTVTDGNTPACQATSPVFAFTVNELPVASPITGDNTVCSNGTLTLTPNATGTAPFTYTWSSSNTFFATINNSGVVDPNAEGTTNIRYTVTDGSSTGCSAISAPFALAVKDAPVAGIITGSSSACIGSTVNLSSTGTGTPVLTYTWASSNTAVATVDNLGTVTAISAGTTNITCTVTDGNTIHCSATSPAFLFTVNSMPATNLTVGGSGAVCYGTSANITVALSETGVNYQLRNSAGNINIGTPVAGNGGTINLPTGNLTAATTFNILAVNPTTLCSAQLSSTASVTIDPLPAGGNISGGTSTIIYGSSTGNMNLTAYSGNIILWQKQLSSGTWTDIPNTNSSFSETPSSAGTWKYRVKVRSGVCPDAFSTESVTTVTKKDLTVTATNQSKTYGSANPQLTMTFTGFVNNESQSVINQQPTATTTATQTSDAGTYPITVSGGTDDNYAFIYVNGTLTITKQQQTVTITDAPDELQVGKSYSLAASSDRGLPVSFESMDTDLATITGNNVTGVRKGKVTIRAFNTGTVNYEPAEAFTEIKIISSHKDILNLFTPNGDGFNDYWELPLMSEWGKCNVRVFNRWGKLVFSNPDYDNLWDGTSDGIRLPEGPYYFIIETENAGIVKGTVNLVR